VLSITYVSSATEEIDETHIEAILVQARMNNVRHDLTGALLFHGGRFVQTLEGPDEQVRARFAVIAADPRHQGVQLISEKGIGARQFPDWTMGYQRDLAERASQLDAFNDFFGARTGLERIKHAENEAQQFLEWMREYWLPA
jgi:hypothetical protein